MASIGRINASLQTDQGRIRDHNEDFIASKEPADANEVARDGWLYIVADGVGGADAGEVASEFATQQTIENYLADDSTADWGERLSQAMIKANSDLREMVIENPVSNRMATTMVAAVFHNNIVTIANVGDSRGYHFKDGKLQQITKDHSLVEKLLEEGAITAVEAMNHPRKNVILHSLGSEATPTIDLFEIELEVGEQIVLCSDGLTRHVLDEEIAYIIGEKSPTEATDALIQLANERGGEDNISVAVMVLEELPTDLPTIVHNTNGRTAGINLTVEDERARRTLWAFTAFLCVVEAVLIIIIWFMIVV